MANRERLGDDHDDDSCQLGMTPVNSLVTPALLVVCIAARLFGICLGCTTWTVNFSRLVYMTAALSS